VKEQGAQAKDKVHRTTAPPGHVETAQEEHYAFIGDCFDTDSIFFNAVRKIEEKRLEETANEQKGKEELVKEQKDSGASTSNESVHSTCNKQDATKVTEDRQHVEQEGLKGKKQQLPVTRKRTRWQCLKNRVTS